LFTGASSTKEDVKTKGRESYTGKRESEPVKPEGKRRSKKAERIVTRGVGFLFLEEREMKLGVPSA